MESPYKPMVVAVIETHPVQYRAPLYRILNLYSEIKPRVFFGSDLSTRTYKDRDFDAPVTWSKNITEGYDHVFLDTNTCYQNINFWRPTGSGIERLLFKSRPDAVLLTCYNSLLAIRALIAATLLGIPIVLRHEASDATPQRSRPFQLLRSAVLSLMYTRVGSFGCIGAQARRHLLKLGVGKNRLHSAPYCVDSKSFALQREHYRPLRSIIREQIGIKADSTVLIFSGKLTEKKNPLLIIDAIRLLPVHIASRIYLLVMGDGVQREELERRASETLKDSFKLLGFVHQEELGKYYTAADCLVLPSRERAGETWGLVVNEALQFGLPAIVSTGVGCFEDCVVEGGTGWVFKDNSADSLADSILEFSALTDAERTTLSEKCEKHSRKFTLEVAARGIVSAVKSLDTRPVQKAQVI